MSLLPGTRVDRYTVLHELGRGGMATVYCVQHQLLGTRHALKVLHDPAAGERLLREGRVQARLDPAHVVPVTDVLEVDGTHALVMPLVEGCSLAEVLAEHRLSVVEVAALFSQICAGVKAAHDAGVMHRDLKPANVLLEVKHGRVVARVADFGLARAEQDVGMTRTGAFLGTPAYASPEQLAGAEVDVQADLWALGVLLYELLTGTRPFPHTGFGELFAAVHAGEVDDSTVPEAWRPVVAALLTHVGRRNLVVLPVEARPLAMGTPVAEIVRVRVEAAATAIADTPTQAVTPTSNPQVPHSLPRERDAFVGRDADLATLETLLSDGAALVSVLGIGGTGKTRLVTHYGWTHLADWPGGVWFCDLSEARSVDGIVHAVARALAVPLGKDDPVTQLGHAIAGRDRCLVILDNFEQVVRDADVTLGHWLDRASEAQFVVTTREVLGLPGETSLPLAPLDNTQAVALFVARARQAKPDFEIAEDLATVSELVRLLDGLPLAIELAAARSRVMPPEKLLSRLGQRFRLLTSTGQRRDRQATLRATLDWSWDLLTAEERSALAQLSVFEGGFTLEGAEEVVDVDALWPEDALQALVDKSLVRVVADGRFDLLVSVQEYAAERLRAAGETLETEQRHGRWCAGFGTDDALDALDRHGGVARRGALTAELDNVLAACRRAADRGDGDVAVPTCRAASAVLELQGPAAAASALAEVVLALTDLAPRARAVVARCAGDAAHVQGRTEEARALYEQSLAAHRDAGDRRSEAVLLRQLGNVHADHGRVDDARAHYEQGLAVARDVGDRRLEGALLGNLGILDWEQGRMGDASALLEHSLSVHCEVGNRRNEGIVLGNLGLLHANQGRMDDARRCYGQALTVHREVGNRRYEAIVLGNLGSLNLNHGRMDEARADYERALAVHREVGNRQSEGRVLSHLGILHWEQGQMEIALGYCEEALAIHRDVGDRRFEGITLGNLGNLHYGMGQMAKARARYEQALAVHREIDDPRFGGVMLGNLGDVCRAQGELDQARRHYEQALAAARETRFRMLEGAVLGSLGALHLRLGAPADALACLEAGEVLLREIGNAVELGKLLCHRAEALAVADPDVARATVSRAERLATEAGVGPDSELGQRIAEVRALMAGSEPA